MGLVNERYTARIKRQKRIRKDVIGNAERPRLSVFRSARHIYAQIINDINGQTLVAASTLDKSFQDKKFDNKTIAAQQVGKLIAERGLEKGVKEVVFDRNGFLYHGRVKAVSDGAREGGLIF